MSKIHVLDAKISNMIAAGEVIERPAAVVKELVENAIDAQSRRIEIVIRDGGTSYIEVIDDGIGMSKEDALLAFERHATSKIQAEQDLWNIHTLGFRGEALPSISSVSEVMLSTCNGLEATTITMASGVLTSIGSGVMRQGTQIRVEQLFYTLPARLKHLKTIPYEFSLISDIVNKLALINPHIAFVLTHDDKEVFRTSGKSDMQQILHAMYGRDVAKAAVPLRYENDEFRLEGYICLPHIHRSNRYHIMTFINDRLVKSYKLVQAIQDGYRDFIASTRFPMAFLSIYLDHKLIDVNVHPSKWEVRLAKEQQLYQFITEAVIYTLKNHLHQSADLIPQQTSMRMIEPAQQMQWQSPDLWNNNQSMFTGSNVNRELVDQNIAAKSSDDSSSNGGRDDFSTTKLAAPATQHRTETNVNLKTGVDNHQIMAGNADKVTVKDEYYDIIGENNSEDVGKMAENVENYHKATISVIGQLHGSYIICQDETGLLVVDQHAANERIRYEQVRQQLTERQMAVQPLLFPLVIPVARTVMERFDELQPVLETIGLNIEMFGDQEIVCRELPLWMQADHEEQLIVDIIDLLLQERHVSVASINKDMLATMACHTSIRFNRTLSRQEMENLMERLLVCENPYHCPHGRPTMLHYDAATFRKRFDRS